MAEAYKPWKVDFDQLNIVSSKSACDPPGYDAQLAREPVVGQLTQRKRKDADLLSKKQAAVMARATGQARQVGFMCFMMYMMGSGVHIMSIVMTTSGLAGPLMAIWKSGEVFPADPEGQLDVLTPRLVYCLIHMGQFLFAMYKLNSMGLLPTHASDWLSGATVPPVLEHAHGPLV